MVCLHLFLLYRKFLGISYRAKNAPQGCARFCCGIMSLNATQKRRRISRCDILCSLAVNNDEELSN